MEGFNKFILVLYLQSLGCDRPVNYKTEKLDEVLKKEFPVSVYNKLTTYSLHFVLRINCEKYFILPNVEGTS